MAKIKYEIERRFLVKKLIYKFLHRANKINIKQGYFELTLIDVSFRIRIINDRRAVITVKSGRGIKRREDEYKINLALGRKLLAICHHRLEKTRYLIDGWEVDFFKGPLRGLIVIERELRFAKEKLSLPYWIKGTVEVTNSLTSHHLARLASELRGSGLSAMKLAGKVRLEKQERQKGSLK